VIDSTAKTRLETSKTEIVIAGGGGAGLAAALTAAEQGCKNIMVLEKSGSPGGNSVLAHDLFAVESPVQKQMGSDARRDQFFKIAMRWAHWSKVNPRLVRAFIDKSGDTVKWLQAKGIQFDLSQYYLNQSPRIRHTIEGEGAQLIKVLVNECKSRGVPILTRTSASKILRHQNNQVYGIMADAGGHSLTIQAKRVIITTGGYAHNRALLQKYCAYYNSENMTSAGVPSNTGDGILMAIEIGAETAGLGHLMFMGPAATGAATARMKFGEAVYNTGILVREPGMLWVNKRGRRFIDEGHNLASFASGNAIAQQPEGIMYAIFDDSLRKEIEAEGLIWPGAYGGQIRTNPRFARPPAGVPLPELGNQLQAAANNGGKTLMAGSINELGVSTGINPLALKATVEEYNTCCDKGLDPIFCKDRRYLLPVRDPPFYAIQCHSSIVDAIGGIKINENMEVLDQKDDPIPGLYAAGSTTGCWESESYNYEMCGHLLGFALNSGRIAGENAVKNL
jgi:fumarate reductase flavoprotein subunit